jgi:hypothetical protein
MDFSFGRIGLVLLNYQMKMVVSSLFGSPGEMIGPVYRVCIVRA